MLLSTNLKPHTVAHLLATIGPSFRYTYSQMIQRYKAGFPRAYLLLFKECITNTMYNVIFKQHICINVPQCTFKNNINTK